MSPSPIGGVRLFGRAVRLTVGAYGITYANPGKLGTNESFDEPAPLVPASQTGANLVVTDLHLSFKIEKSSVTMPNSSEITVYNLSRPHRAMLQGPSKFLQLEVGNSSSSLSTIFLGNTRYIDHLRKGPDWETVIHAGDGIDAYQFAPAAFTSCPPGLPVPFLAVATQYAQCIQNFDSTIDTTQFLADVAAIPGPTWATPVFKFGYSAEGNAFQQLETFLRTSGFRVSIQNHRMRLTALGPATWALLPKLPVYLLSASTGLLDSPEHVSGPVPGVLTDSQEAGEADPSGQVVPNLNAKTLLLPQILPGDTVQLNSQQYKGAYTVVKLTHSGDMAGDAWWSELELQPT